MSQKQLLVVYHSQSGSTEKMAQAVVEGARASDAVNVVLRRAYEAGAADLLASDAVLLGTPENLGYMSGGLKDFFDRTYYTAQRPGAVLPYAVFVSAGNDGRGAVREIDRIVLGYPMKKVAEPLIARGLPDQAVLDRCSELGQSVALGLDMGIF